jgi:hypothetical protein
MGEVFRALFVLKFKQFTEAAHPLTESIAFR